MLQTEARSEGHNDSETVSGTPRPLYVYTHTELVISMTINIEVSVTHTRLVILRDTKMLYIPNFRFLLQKKISDICYGNNYFRTEVSGQVQGHSDIETVCIIL